MGSDGEATDSILAQTDRILRSLRNEAAKLRTASSGPVSEGAGAKPENNVRLVLIEQTVVLAECLAQAIRVYTDLSSPVRTHITKGVVAGDGTTGSVSHDAKPQTPVSQQGPPSAATAMTLTPISAIIAGGKARGNEQKLEPRPAAERDEKKDHVVLEGLQLEVNHRRQAVLPGCGLYDPKFQRLAEFARAEGELPDFWIRDAKGVLIPDPDRYTDSDSFQRSAFRHLERALYRVCTHKRLL